MKPDLTQDKDFANNFLASATESDIQDLKSAMTSVIALRQMSEEPQLITEYLTNKGENPSDENTSDGDNLRSLKKHFEQDGKAGVLEDEMSRLSEKYAESLRKAQELLDARNSADFTREFGGNSINADHLSNIEPIGFDPSNPQKIPQEQVDALLATIGKTGLKAAAVATAAPFLGFAAPAIGAMIFKSLATQAAFSVLAKTGAIDAATAGLQSAVQKVSAKVEKLPNNKWSPLMKIAVAAITTMVAAGVVVAATQSGEPILDKELASGIWNGLTGESDEFKKAISETLAEIDVTTDEVFEPSNEADVNAEPSESPKTPYEATTTEEKVSQEIAHSIQLEKARLEEVELSINDKMHQAYSAGDGALGNQLADQILGIQQELENLKNLENVHSSERGNILLYTDGLSMELEAQKMILNDLMHESLASGDGDTGLKYADEIRDLQSKIEKLNSASDSILEKTLAERDILSDLFENANTSGDTEKALRFHEALTDKDTTATLLMDHDLEQSDQSIPDNAEVTPSNEATPSEKVEQGDHVDITPTEVEDIPTVEMVGVTIEKSGASLSSTIADMFEANNIEFESENQRQQAIAKVINVHFSDMDNVHDIKLGAKYDFPNYSSAEQLMNDISGHDLNARNIVSEHINPYSKPDISPEIQQVIPETEAETKIKSDLSSDANANYIGGMNPEALKSKYEDMPESKFSHIFISQDNTLRSNVSTKNLPDFVDSIIKRQLEHGEISLSQSGLPDYRDQMINDFINANPSVDPQQPIAELNIPESLTNSGNVIGRSQGFLDQSGYESSVKNLETKAYDLEFANKHDMSTPEGKANYDMFKYVTESVPSVSSSDIYLSNNHGTLSSNNDAGQTISEYADAILRGKYESGTINPVDNNLLEVRNQIMNELLSTNVDATKDSLHHHIVIPDSLKEGGTLGVRNEGVFDGLFKEESPLPNQPVESEGLAAALEKAITHENSAIQGADQINASPSKEEAQIKRKSARLSF